MKPRAFTAEEVRTKVLNHIRVTAQYWSDLPDKTPQERCDGVAFSILAMIDGVTMTIPALDLVLCPHPQDKKFCIDHGENWFKPGMLINDCHLHELYYEKKKS